MCADARFVEAGALMSYGENFVARYRRAAFIVDKVLRGTKPSDIPVEQSMDFEFVVNLRTATTLGLTIPGHVMVQVSRVIKSTVAPP
jgi:putative ABC transport system substrate-binding protein